MKTLVKRASVLLVSHLLNILVAIGGLVGVSLLLAGLLLNLLWAVGILVVAILAIPCVLLEQLPDRLSCLKGLGYAVVVVFYLALYVASWFTIYTAVGPYVLVFGGAVGLALFYLVLWIIQTMMKADARLANFASFAIPSSLLRAEEPLQSKECAEKFRIKLTGGISAYLPVFEMTSRMWVIVLYFTVLKPVIGGLSAAAIFLAVVQPAIALFGGGDAPFFTEWMTFHDNPVVYFGVILLIWIVGAVGLVMVAAVSAQVTSRAFGEWKPKQSQSENGVEATAA